MTKMLMFSVLSAVMLLGVLTFQWSIVDALTPFIGVPLLGLMWLLAIVSIVSTVVYAYRYRRVGVSAYVPMMVSTAALLAALFVPFTELWLYVNFHSKKVAREQVVAKVTSGVLVPNVDYNAKLIALPAGTGVSMGGDDIVVEGPSGDPYVFFFTFRGVLDNYSGFLWVPDGGSPEQFSDASEPGTQIESFGGHWYFIGHR